MGLMEQIKRDIQQITSNTNEFATPITFTTPDGATTVTIGGIGVKNHLTYDPHSGQPVSTKQARISISEQSLVDANYPLRNDKNEIVLIKHIVSFADVSGITWTYKVSVNFPGETTGSIVCSLQDYIP